jgi:ATP-binding cassette, subfamily B, bacterial
VVAKKNLPGTAALQRIVRGRRVPFIAQLTPTDCGVACLTAVLNFHRKEVTTNEVRARLSGGRNGVTARQIVNAAREFGLSARGVAITPDKLQFLPQGSVIHWELAHFVVFERLVKGGIEIMDPGVGRRMVEMAEVGKCLSGVAITFEPGEQFTVQKRESKERFRRYKEWLFGARELWVRVLVTSFFLQLISLGLPGLTGSIVDKVVPRSDRELLTLICCAFVTLGSFYFLSTFLRSRLLLQLRTRVESRMSFAFVEHLLELPYAFFQQRSAGDLMMRLSSQSAIRELLTTGALSALLDGVMVSVYFFLLLGAAPRLAVIALVCAVLQGLIYALAGGRSKLLVSESLAAQGRLESYQVELLSGIETLKSMGGTDRATQRWSDLYVDVLNRSIVSGELDGTFGSLVGIVRFAGPVTLLLAGVFQVLDGSLSLGTMLGLSALGTGFLDPVANLVGTGMKLTHLKGYMERIEDVLDAERERRGGQGQNEAVLSLRGAVRLEGIAFKYPSEAKATVEDVSFAVQPGESVAIVGASGSGKSTIARVLAGLYQPFAGTVFYDEKPASSLDLRKLRERLGVVTQDVRLFSGSIRDNVTMFDPLIGQDRVQRACELAALHDDIMAMPMGYDTVLADGGSSLSGGQRQRLALARALVRGPAVLVLDEATSALDTVTEGRVQECLRAVKCTRVIVAHRLSTIIEADKIVVMHLGKVAAVGRHHELLASSPEYQRLVRAQHEQQTATTGLLGAEPMAAVAPSAAPSQRPPARPPSQRPPAGPAMSPQRTLLGPATPTIRPPARPAAPAIERAAAGGSGVPSVPKPGGLPQP